MQSKEEIRNRHLHKNGLSVNNTPVGKAIQKAAFDAMEEYAKEFTKDFIDRISRNPIDCYSQKITGQDKQFFLGANYIQKLKDALK